LLGFRELDNEDPNDAALMANLGRFHNLLTDYETANRIGGRTPHWKQDLRNLCWFISARASEITAYTRCPYMYLLREVYGYQPQLNEAIGYGKGVHFCLKRTVELVKRDGQNPITAAATAIDKDFYMPYAGGQVLENYRRGAREAVMLYARKHAVDLGESSEVEYRIEFLIHNATVMGRIDVLESNEVRDYKTSYDYVEPNEVAMQIRIYAAGLRKLGRQIDKGSVAYLSSENVSIEAIDVSEPTVEYTVQEAEKVVKSIIDGSFTPKPGTSCQKCDQGPICRWRHRLANDAPAI
jgi:DNA helicase-2/ATP-dependent DNA helicase PcrA